MFSIKTQNTKSKKGIMQLKGDRQLEFPNKWLTVAGTAAILLLLAANGSFSTVHYGTIH